MDVVDRTVDFKARKRLANQKWYAKTRETRLQKGREKYLSRKDKHLAACKAWQLRNTLRVKNFRQFYLETHRESINARRREYRKKNLESHRGYGRKYYAKNKERIALRRSENWREKRKRIWLSFQKIAKREYIESFYENLWNQEAIRQKEITQNNKKWINSDTKNYQVWKGAHIWNRTYYHPLFKRTKEMIINNALNGKQGI